MFHCSVCSLVVFRRATGGNKLQPVALIDIQRQQIDCSGSLYVVYSVDAGFEYHTLHRLQKLKLIVVFLISSKQRAGIWVKLCQG